MNWNNLQGSFMDAYNRTKTGYGNVAAAGRMTGTQRMISQFGAGRSFMGYGAGSLMRGAGVGLLGLYTARQAYKSYDSLRNGNVLGGMVSAGLGAAAAYGLYKSNLLKNVTRNHLMTQVAEFNAVKRGIGAAFRSFR